MNKKVLILAALLNILPFGKAWLGYAQTALDQDFESFDFTGWTRVYPQGYNTDPETGVTFGWQTATYSGDTQLSKETNVGSNKLGGTTALKSFTGKYGSTTNLVNDNWLISPEVTVDAAHCYLTFQFGANDQININSKTTSDENRMKLQVLVSTEGTDTATFKDAKIQIIPMGVQKWCSYCINLSDYIGKTIRVAFRDYGSSVAGSVRDSKFIDNLKLGSQPSSDYAVTATSAITGGAVYEQPYTITVSNYGVSSGGFTASYKLGEKTVSEVVSTDIATGAAMEYTFKEPLRFTPGETTSFTAWVTGTDDAFTSNDSTSAATITAAPQQDLPYASATETLQDEFTGVTSNSTNATCVYDASKAFGWLFTQKKANKEGYAYLYSNKAFHLPKGDVRLSLTGTVIGTDISYEVYIAKYGATKMADYATLVGKSETLPASDTDADADINLVIPEAGYYVIGIRPMASTVNDQTAIHGFSIEAMTGGDMAVTAVNSPAKAVVAGEQAVTVNVRNNASTDEKNITVAYQVNADEPVRETIESVKGGEAVTHTFGTNIDMSSVGIYSIKAWVEKNGDTDTSNDTLSLNSYAYEAKTFPYTTSFENQTDSLEWQDVNVGSSTSYWGAAQNIYAIDGKRVMYIDRNVAARHDNYAVSPALKLNEWQGGRLSFYYIGTASTSGTLSVYLVKSFDKDSLAKATPVKTVTVLPTYSYFSEYVSVKDAGTYYIVLRHSGSGYDIWFDDLRFDDTQEVLVTGASTDVQGTTDTATETALTMTLYNAGSKDLENAKVSYTVKGGATVTETVDLLPCFAYLNYTFKTKIALDKPGQDTITVSVSHSEDSDLKNNTITILGPTKVQYLAAPFTYGFEDASQNTLCTLDNNWTIGTKSPSDGKSSLLHQYSAAEGGDWAYLPAMKLAKGSYDLSFFWKSYTSQTHSSPQSFGVYILNSLPTQSSYGGVIIVKELTDVTNATYQATKELETVEIPYDGIYYIGIKCTTAVDPELESQSINQLVLDQFELTANPVEGFTIAKGETLRTNLRDTEWWHRYYTSTSAAKQWTDVADSETAISTTRQYNTSTDIWNTPGMLRSMPVAVKAGEKYAVTMSYSIDKVGATALDGNSTLTIYASSRDLPQDYTTAVVQGKEKSQGAMIGELEEVTGYYTPSENGIVYFGIICDSKVSAKFTLNAVNIANTDKTGISEVSSSRFQGDDTPCYNLAGQKVNPSAGTSTHGSGIIITRGRKIIK